MIQIKISYTGKLADSILSNSDSIATLINFLPTIDSRAEISSIEITKVAQIVAETINEKCPEQVFKIKEKLL